MKFLIATEPDDYHALLVKRALENSGHLIRLLFTADQPTIQKNSIFIDSNIYQWISTEEFHSISDNIYDVVWWRRVRKPYIPRDSIHPDDYQIALRENNLFYESLTNNIAPNAWWVNSKESARKARSKLSQLKTAVDCGMKIPSTLCTNDPQHIRDFVARHEAKGIIYKALSTNLWCEEQKVKITFTSKINSNDLPKDELLQFAPGLYQEEIKKSYELRITCFGEYIVAAKLNSQNHPEGKIDWRKIPDGKLDIEPYQLPNTLERKICVFMEKMGLVFGALDFIVDENGEYFFLEVNEQGQFLWIEDYNAEFKMLDIFVNFLINRSIKFQWNSNTFHHQMINYFDGIDDIVTNNLKHHVNINQSAIYCQK